MGGREKKRELPHSDISGGLLLEMEDSLSCQCVWWGVDDTLLGCVCLKWGSLL